MLDEPKLCPLCGLAIVDVRRGGETAFSMVSTLKSSVRDVGLYGPARRAMAGAEILNLHDYTIKVDTYSYLVENSFHRPLTGETLHNIYSGLTYLAVESVNTWNSNSTERHIAGQVSKAGAHATCSGDDERCFGYNITMNGTSIRYGEEERPTHGYLTVLRVSNLQYQWAFTIRGLKTNETVVTAVFQYEDEYGIPREKEFSHDFRVSLKPVALIHKLLCF